jgi:hypothetical protein
MRTVRIPLEVELAPPKYAEKDGKPVLEVAAKKLSFAAFLIGTVLDAVPLGDEAAVRLALGLVEKLPEQLPGAPVDLTDAEHELLAKTMAGLRMQPGMRKRLLPFFAAVHGLPDPRF